MSGGRVARVRPTMTPDSWTSTSTERFPFSQSRAISPCAPAGWAAASAGQQVEQGHAAPLGLVPVVGRDGVIEEPGEDVADPALPGLVAELPGDDAAVHHPAHAGHLGERGRVHHVTGRGTHDGHHLTRRDGVGGGRGDVRVHVADGHGDALGQPGPGGRLGGQRRPPGTRAATPGGPACPRRSWRSRGSARRGSPPRDSGRPGRCPCTRRCRCCGSRCRTAAR